MGPSIGNVLNSKQYRTQRPFSETNFIKLLKLTLL